MTRINLMKAYNENYDTPIRHAKAVAVVGGGNVAMDAARSAKRLGAEHVYIVYRRSEEEMPARAEEIHHAKEEGIEFMLLTNPTKVLGNENGEVCGLECVKMELGEPDESGRRRPKAIEGSEFVLEVDSVIMSVGTSPAEMPARAEEIHHAKEEGIEFMLLTNPTKVLGNADGEVCGLECVKMELGEPDESGRRRPKAVEGSEFVLDVDSVIMSVGTSPNPLIRTTTQGLEANRRGCLVADEETMQTTREGVYAGGDAVTGAATVILAMGAGKTAAASIDEYLKTK